LVLEYSHQSAERQKKQQSAATPSQDCVVGGKVCAPGMSNTHGQGEGVPRLVLEYSHQGAERPKEQQSAVTQPQDCIVGVCVCVRRPKGYRVEKNKNPGDKELTPRGESTTPSATQPKGSVGGEGLQSAPSTRTVARGRDMRKGILHKKKQKNRSPLRAQKCACSHNKVR